MSALRTGLAALLLGTCLSITSPAGATEYLFYRLESLGGAVTFPADINNAGGIAGNAYAADNRYTHAVRWSGTQITNLGTPGAHSYGNAINEAGIVGGSLEVNGRLHAGVWRGTVFTDMHPAGAYTSEVDDLNNRGQAVGTSSNPEFSVDGLVWNGLTSTKLAQPADGQAYPEAINDAGQIAGAAWGKDFPYAAVRWDNDEIKLYAGLPGSADSWAGAINQAGQMAGSSTNGSQNHAVIWDGDRVVDLDPTGPYSFAAGLNNVGQAVGVSESFPDTFGNAGPVIWDGTTMTAITGAVPREFYPRDINDNGLIVGTSLSLDAVYSAWLAVPIPEPNAVAMLVAGLGVVTGAGRLRHR